MAASRLASGKVICSTGVVVTGVVVVGVVVTGVVVVGVVVVGVVVTGVVVVGVVVVGVVVVGDSVVSDEGGITSHIDNAITAIPMKPKIYRWYLLSSILGGISLIIIKVRPITANITMSKPTPNRMSHQ
jgi:hypothetical protein